MFLFRRILPVLIVVLFFSCAESEEEREISKGLRVLVLGNSVLRHAPAPDLGWYGDWGMAATTPEKDFVRVYNRLLQSSGHYSYVEVSSKNIATWENNFAYNLQNYVDIASGTYDVVVVRLGENVRTTRGYEEALIDMIEFFKSENTQVIITGTIWEDVEKESIQEQVAIKLGYTYVPFDGFRSNILNYAFGQYENPGVAGHPSDQGMESIAELLLEATLSTY